MSTLAAHLASPLLSSNHSEGGWAWLTEVELNEGARRALVVDDDAAIRILVSRILRRHGFVVDAAVDGAEAIEDLLRHDYDLITLDLMMPRIDGYGVVKYLQEHKPELFNHLIVMTAFGPHALEGICPPVVRTIHKPFEIEELLREAEEAVAS